MQDIRKPKHHKPSGLTDYAWLENISGQRVDFWDWVKVIGGIVGVLLIAFLIGYSHYRSTSRPWWKGLQNVLVINTTLSDTPDQHSFQIQAVSDGKQITKIYLSDSDSPIYTSYTSCDVQNGIHECSFELGNSGKFWTVQQTLNGSPY